MDHQVLLLVILCLSSASFGYQPSPPKDLNSIPADRSNYCNEEYNQRNYTVCYGRTSSTINYIFIHTTQETYNRTIELFQTPNYLSSHYVVNNLLAPNTSQNIPDGLVTQMVNTTNAAYHVSDANEYSIGIEHVGVIDSQLKVMGGFSFPMYWNSAQLSAYLAFQYNIPIDRNHILGHDQNAQIGGTSTHVDPGIDWDWNLYMTLVNYFYTGQCNYLTIHIGDTGRSVTALQYLLNTVGYSTAASGNYTYITERAVLLFQEDYGIPATGVVDNLTWEKIVETAVAMHTQGIANIATYLLQYRYYYSVSAKNYTQVLSNFQTEVCDLEATGQLDYSTVRCLITGCTKAVSTTSEKSTSDEDDKNLPKIVLVVGYVGLALATVAILIKDRVKKPQLVIQNLH